MPDVVEWLVSQPGLLSPWKILLLSSLLIDWVDYSGALDITPSRSQMLDRPAHNVYTGLTDCSL